MLPKLPLTFDQSVTTSPNTHDPDKISIEGGALKMQEQHDDCEESYLFHDSLDRWLMGLLNFAIAYI